MATEDGRTWARALGAWQPAAGYRVFRRLLGALWAAAAVRFVANGWVAEQYLDPDVHFPWIDGLTVPSPTVMYALFAVQAVAGLLVAADRWPRRAAAAWWVAFVWVELLDRTWYLNHYVLLSVLGALVVAVPVRAHGGARWVPAWGLALLKAQVALVYLWAGLAKLNADWLVRGEPLHTWLASRMDWPVVGPWLARPELAVGMSWGGMLYDLAVPFLLLLPRTRPVAYGLVVGFHVVTGLLFPIGVFPWVMVLASTLFLPADWPVRHRGTARAVDPPPPHRLSGAGLAGVVLVGVLMAGMPVRHVLYGPDVNWTEQGFRLSWRVLLIEKTGFVTFTAEERTTGRRWTVEPRDDLTPVQHQQMRTQPDLIAQYARHIARGFAARGHDVAVYADAWAALNGRPTQRLIRPDVDLTQPWWDRHQQGWIVPRGQQLLRDAARAESPSPAR